MKKILLILAVLMVGTSTTVNATLFNRGTDSLGNRLIYDSDLNITWYDYSPPPFNWLYHINWTASLDVNFNGTHYTDWRLPTVIPQGYSYSLEGTTSFGYNNTTGSEMGHLFYVALGNKGYVAADNTWPQAGWGLVNTGMFLHLRPENYFSGTEYAPFTITAWMFNFNNGLQFNDGKGRSGYALAVRSGDVVATPVPEPATFFLLGAGLLGLVVFRIKRQSNTV